MRGGAFGLSSAGSEGRESLASARLAVALGCMLLVSGIPNTFPALFPALLEEFGRSRAATASALYGVIFGLIGIGNSLGAATGPLLSGALYDWTGSYLVIYLCAMGILLVGLAALALFCLLTRG